MTNQYGIRKGDLQDELNARQMDDQVILQNFQSSLTAFQSARNIVAPFQNLYTQKISQDIQIAGEKERAEREATFNNPNLDSADAEEADRALRQTLQQYYDQYGQIIQRDMNVTLSDIKKYAQEKGISLSQALQENFVTPLKGKKEYQEITNQML
jgi:folylpolyglutamate synthase/dihydropteroate synthase